MLADFQCELVALELERTFWEKATILHAEYHREAAKPIRDRFSRHYSDVAAMARYADIAPALNDHELRQRVADWKSRFFAANWEVTRNIPSPISGLRWARPAESVVVVQRATCRTLSGADWLARLTAIR